MEISNVTYLSLDELKSINGGGFEMASLLFIRRLLNIPASLVLWGLG